MKMDDDSVKSSSRLDVSVSFGRFENDALSWEKWSTFSPNKYLEEVGSLSTPGSVAQKKAYFEAHYKKIAARKAEEHEQSPSPDVSSMNDHAVKSSQSGIKFSLSSNERLVGEVVAEAFQTASTNAVIADEEKDNTDTASKEDEHVACINDKEMTASVAMESGTSAVQGAVDLTDVNVDNPELNMSKDALLVVVKTPEKEHRRIVKESPESKHSLRKSTVSKKESLKLNSKSTAQKVTPINKERNLSGTRTKVVSSPAKPLPATTPRQAKPTLIRTPITPPQSSKKNVNNSAPTKIKTSQKQSKRVAPTSLHMSLSLGIVSSGPVDSPGARPMTRKSLIMENMGDKDIVKRAFKMFQNRANGFATNEKPTPVKHVSTASCEPKKGNGGLRKDKRSNQGIQSGTKSNLLGLRKSTPSDKKSPKTLSPGTGLRKDDNAEKRKELLKKLGTKSIGREAQNAQHDAKSKVSVGNEIHRRHTLNR